MYVVGYDTIDVYTSPFWLTACVRSWLVGFRKQQHHSVSSNDIWSQHTLSHYRCRFSLQLSTTTRDRIAVTADVWCGVTVSVHSSLLDIVFQSVSLQTSASDAHVYSKHGNSYLSPLDPLFILIHLFYFLISVFFATYLHGRLQTHGNHFFQQGSRSKMKFCHATWYVDFHHTPWYHADC